MRHRRVMSKMAEEFYQSGTVVFNSDSGLQYDPSESRLGSEQLRLRLGLMSNRGPHLRQ